MKVKELFTDESKWCKNVPARDVNGEEIVLWDEKAVCWCLLAAVDLCYGIIAQVTGEVNITGKIVEKLNLHIENIEYPDEEKFTAITNWNDDPARTFQDIKNLVEELDI